MPDLATLQSNLAEAEAALHALTIGNQRVVVERQGTKITYTAANVSTLKSYIATLKSQIAAAGGTIPGVQLPRRGILYNQF